MQPLYIFSLTFILTDVIVFAACIITIVGAIRAYQKAQHPSLRARIGIILMCLVFIVSLILFDALLPYIDKAHSFTIFLLPFVICILFFPINNWTSLSEHIQKNQARNRLANLLIIFAVILMLIAIGIFNYS